MIEILKITFMVSLLGGISSAIGGIFCSLINTKNNRLISILQQITDGIMTGIVCLDMLPCSFKITQVWISSIMVIIGVVIVYFFEKIIYFKNTYKKNNYIISILILISMGFHNIIEGIAIGSSFMYSFKMGIVTIIAIILHDIPEGIVVGISSKVAGNKISKVILDTFISGGITGLGALIGQLLGKINDIFVGSSLSIASGVMLYIISCELIPVSYNFNDNKKNGIFYIIGILASIIIVGV